MVIGILFIMLGVLVTILKPDMNKFRWERVRLHRQR